MTNGTIVLNGITDQQLVTVLESKIRNEGKFGFNPQAMQLVNGQPKTLYNNLTLTWNGDIGLKVILELLTELEGHHHLHVKEAA